MRVLFNFVRLFEMEFFMRVVFSWSNMFVYGWGLYHRLLRRLNRGF